MIRTSFRLIALGTYLLVAPAGFIMAAAVDAPDSNPATEKFHQDIKTAVMNGSLTIPQVKELQASLAALKESKAAQKPGAPLDLVTPYGAVSKIKAVMATVKQPDRETLEQDFQVVVANKQPTASAEPETPGKKLGKDVYLAVMRGNPTEAQVQQLQQSLNSLQSLKASGEGKLQQFRSLKQAKSEIEQTMNAGSFRPQDRQAVLDDLNALGPQGGGMRRGG